MFVIIFDSMLVISCLNGSYDITEILASGAYEKTDYTPAFNDSKNIVFSYNGGII
jgi:hypothetical protein